MKTKRILIVEDDADIRELIRQNVVKESWSAQEASDGRKALAAVQKTPPDIVILDLMLPEIDGKEVCRILKVDPKTRCIPILMLTAKGDEIDRIIGFELGADDYMAKPFSPRELILRIKAILKRAGEKSDSTAETVLRQGILEMNFQKRTTLIKGKPIDLTKIEFDLLATLARRPGVVFSRQELLDLVLGIDAEIESRTIDMHISHLRDRLGTFGKNIETVRGLGYRMSEEGLSM